MTTVDSDTTPATVENDHWELVDTDDIGSNPTDNASLVDLAATRVSRRTLIGGSAALAAAGLIATQPATQRVAAAGLLSTGLPTPTIGFTEVPTSSDDTIVVPPGYTAQVLIPWGTPLFSDAAAFAEDASNTAADQERQVGFNHDGMHYFPLWFGWFGNRAGLLVLNHEYTDANQIYTAVQGTTITPDAAGLEKVAKAIAGHGVTVVEVRQQRDGSWSHVVDSRFNRRVTGATPVAFSGPVGADHPMLQSAVTPSPIGTLNNCSHGYTPWGTYLACEENWNGYFGTDDPAWVASPLEARYGVSKTGFGYNWHKASPRFDLAQNRNEINRFGWVVEINPFNPRATPVKRTALGRIKHEGATVTESRGRVVVYTGDDENGDYLYKFVGANRWFRDRVLGRSPLDNGTLYVAVCAADGSGSWAPLVHGTGPLIAANGWIDQADVLIRTRQAADAVGATKLHRPEWVAVDESTKDVYVTLTNGSGNNAPVNSGRDPNPFGHIVRIREAGADNTATTFGWDIYAYAGDPNFVGTPAAGALPAGANVPATQPLFGSPDGLWIDRDRRVWIQTDISNSSQNLVSRGYDRIGNNQMLVGNPDTGEIRRFLTGPRGCEVTGCITTPDQRTMFVNIQHPGESSTYWNTLNGAPTPATPTAVSSWPYGTRPRPSTVVIRKDDGGVIGT